MYHNVFRYEFLTFQTQIHLHKQYIFDTNIIQSEYAFLFPFSILFRTLNMHYSIYMFTVRLTYVNMRFKNARFTHVALLTM